MALVALARGWISPSGGGCVAPTRSSLLLARRYLSRSLPLFFAAMSVTALGVLVNSFSRKATARVASTMNVPGKSPRRHSRG
ncbi:MAG: hypothetical protein ACRDIV_10840, partial [Ktedonobacteraceae bacterium]